MKLHSKYFDSIRVGSKRPQEGDKKPSRTPVCQWKGCDKPGAHKAPKGRGRDGEYFFFCVDHVRQYNQSYNYFDGMSDAEVSSFIKDAMTGHRPTWKMGAGLGSDGTGASAKAARFTGAPNDPLGVLAGRARAAREAPVESRRKLKPIERRSLDALNLDENASKDEIKARFKELVKLHHPDANGGDSRSEDRLRDIIQAYNHLKQAGLV